ncbi:hypothetical protein M8J76_006262 [Diaphorina citri]|nr:hypothetical protein M8J76_006262 [Diaphorina citri]
MNCSCFGVEFLKKKEEEEKKKKTKKKEKKEEEDEEEKRVSERSAEGQEGHWKVKKVIGRSRRLSKGDHD